jgi:hypothetical protein
MDRMGENPVKSASEESGNKEQQTEGVDKEEIPEKQGKTD